MNNILNSFIGGAIKNRLQSMGIDTNGINFNDMNSLNDFAKNIIPGLLKGNPQAKEMIKQNMGNLDKETQDEVVKVIDGQSNCGLGYARVKDGTKYVRDQIHLTPLGAKNLGQYFYSQIKNIPLFYSE